MVLYCGIFIWSVINTLIIKLKEKHNYWFYVLVLLPPVLFATLRYNIGTDYMNYWYFYQGGNYFSAGYEPLFGLLNYIAKAVFHDFYGVLLISALLTYGFLLATLIRLKNEISISIALWVYYCYYYVASYNVMRQLIAVSIVLFATVLLNEDKKIKFAILVVVATMFHSSAILAMIFILFKLVQKVNSKYWTAVMYLGAVVLVFAGGYILNSLGGLLGEYSKYLTGAGGIVSFAYIVDILPTFLVVAIPAIVYLRYYSKDGENYDLFCIIGIFSIVILVMGYHFRWFQRVLYYFDVMQVVIIGLYLKRIRLPQNRKIIKVAVTLFYLFYFWYSSVFRGSNGGVPYQSIILPIN